jgi:small subunit ribosomal protein S6
LNQYELLFIVDPKLPEDELAALQERITNLIAANQGEVEAAEVMGTRRLAYPIKKLEEGKYTLITFKSAATFIAILDKQLRLLQPIVRFIIVRKEE